MALSLTVFPGSVVKIPHNILTVACSGPARLHRVGQQSLLLVSGLAAPGEEVDVIGHERVRFTVAARAQEEIQVPRGSLRWDEHELAALREILRSASLIHDQSPVERSISFSRPIANSKVTSAFGTDRIYLLGGGKRGTNRHLGTDYSAKPNTALESIAEGQVHWTGRSSVAGLCCIVKHPQSVSSAYFHLEDISKKVGDSVKAGETLGLTGNSGRSTGPHLHLEVCVKGLFVDPESWIQTLGSLSN